MSKLIEVPDDFIVREPIMDGTKRVGTWNIDLSFMPSVNLVRCRECKHFNLITHECENELLSTDHEGGASYSLNFYDDDFCSYGELRETSHD